MSIDQEIKTFNARIESIDRFLKFCHSGTPSRAVYKALEERKECEDEIKRLQGEPVKCPLT